MLGMNRRNTPRGQMSMGKGGPAIQMMEGGEFAMSVRLSPSCIYSARLEPSLDRFFGR